MKHFTRRGFLLSSSLAGAAGALFAGSALSGCRSLGAGPSPWPVRPRYPDSESFLRAVVDGDVEAVRRGLAERPELLRCGDERGRSAFVLAHLHEHPDVAQLFLDGGLELDLVEATLAEHWDDLDGLIAADPESINRGHPIGGTALYAAALLGREKLYRLQFLGGDPDANPAGGSGHTPVRACLDYRNLEVVHDIAVALVANGGDANAAQRDGDSPLHAAVRRDSPFLVRFLVRKGADPAARDAAGRTPLDVARQLHRARLVDMLAHEADIERDHSTSRFAYDASGAPFVRPDMTGLPHRLQSDTTGASHNNLPKVREMLALDRRYAFSISAQDELTIEACSHVGNVEIVRFYLDLGLPQSLLTSLTLGDVARARALLEEDPLRIHERGPHDFAPMWYAAIGGGNIEAAELLLDFGADVDQASMDTTALHWAARRGQVDLAAFLLERGAELDPIGWKFPGERATPYQMAVAGGHDDVARLLRDAGGGGGAPPPGRQVQLPRICCLNFSRSSNIVRSRGSLPPSSK